MLKDIEERLTTLGLSSAFVADFLQPVQRLASSSVFWRHQSKGLAIFLAPDSLHILRLPYPFERQAAVSNQFYIRPLLPLISADGRFYVLTLKRDAIDLLQGTREGLDRVEVTEAPETLEAMWKRESPTVQIPTREEGQEICYWPATFAGPGLEVREDEGGVADHFRRLDKGLNQLLDAQVPLVLAGPSAYRSLYREISSYPELMPQGIDEKERQHLGELQRQGREIVEPDWKRKKRRALAEYERLAEGGSVAVSDDLEEILLAAYKGEVKTLFVPMTLQRWGTFEGETGYVTSHAEPEAGDVELLDQAAGYTFVRGGEVYTEGSKGVQVRDSVAAVFRY
jgi:hypothetical protein